MSKLVKLEIEGEHEKTEQNLKATEDFVLEVLSKNFGQMTVDRDRLREAAEKLCDAIPTKGMKPSPATLDEQEDK